MTNAAAPGARSVRWREALPVWARIALLSFGGPAGQLAVAHRVLVEEKGWVSESRFLHAMNYCMLLPGPEAQQLVTYMGWLLQGQRGGLVAGGLFIVPGLISILLLSILYAGFQDLAIVSALFFGLKPAVIAIIVQAVLKIGRRAIKDATAVILAASAFIAMFAFAVPFPYIVIAAAMIGFATSVVKRRAARNAATNAATTAPAGDSHEQVDEDASPTNTIYSAASRQSPTMLTTLRTVAFWLAI